MKISKLIKLLGNYDPDVEVGMINTSESKDFFDVDILTTWASINENNEVIYPHYIPDNSFGTGFITLSVF